MSWNNSRDGVRKFGKGKFKKCLRIILTDEISKFGKDKFGNCLIEYLYDEDFDLESWWGWREREFRLGEIGWLTEESGWIKWECTGYLYPVMAQSSDRPIGERVKIAMFALGSFDRRGEVRSGGCSELLRFLRLSHNSTENIFADECFAAKS